MNLLRDARAQDRLGRSKVAARLYGRLALSVLDKKPKTAWVLIARALVLAPQAPKLSAVAALAASRCGRTDLAFQAVDRFCKIIEWRANRNIYTVFFQTLVKDVPDLVRRFSDRLKGQAPPIENTLSQLVDAMAEKFDLSVSQSLDSQHRLIVQQYAEHLPVTMRCRDCVDLAVAFGEMGFVEEALLVMDQRCVDTWASGMFGVKSTLLGIKGDWNTVALIASQRLKTLSLDEVPDGDALAECHYQLVLSGSKLGQGDPVSRSLQWLGENSPNYRSSHALMASLNKRAAGGTLE